MLSKYTHGNTETDVQSYYTMSPFRIVLNVPVQVSELIHGGEGLDCPPSDVGDEVDGAGGVGGGREPEQKVQLCRVDLLLHEEDLEGHLGREYELVALEKASGRVHEDGVGHTVRQISDPETKFR